MLTMIQLQIHLVQLAAARLLPIAGVAIAPEFQEKAGVSELLNTGIALVLDLPQAESLPRSSIDLAKSLREAEPGARTHQHF
jgi:hypothetical protein